MSSREVRIWRIRFSHQTIRLSLLLLPVWILGAGELARFAFNNSLPGSLERNGMVKGRDFVQFYVAGTLAREGAWRSLYDLNELEQHVARVVPAAAGQIPAPLYGPQVALFFAPLSTLPYLEARWWWCTLSAVMYLLAATLVIQTSAPLHGKRLIASITVVCNPLFAMLLSAGQTGAIAALAWALATATLTTGHRFLFGMCLGVLAYKPPLLVGIVPILIILKDGAALSGIVASGLAQCSLGLALTGVDPWRHYLAAAASAREYYFLTDTLPYQKHSLVGFFQLLIPSEGIAAIVGVSACVAVLVLWWCHRREAATRWMVPMLTSTSLLLSPHLYVYDLVVLLPALLVVADSLRSHNGSAPHRSIAGTGFALLFAPYSGAIASWSHVQLSTIGLVAFLVLLQRRQRFDAEESRPGAEMAFRFVAEGRG